MEGTNVSWVLVLNIIPSPTQKILNSSWLCLLQVDEGVSDVTALVLMFWQCLNIGVRGMFTLGPSRSRSRDNSKAPAPINSGVGSQQRSIHCGVESSNQRPVVCQHWCNYYPHILFNPHETKERTVSLVQFCSKKKAYHLQPEGSWMMKRIWTSNVYWGYFNDEEWKLWDISIHRNVFILLLLLQFNFNNPYTNIQEQHHIKWD